MSEYETRSTLIERVRDPNDSDSWREFVDLYEPLLMRFVLRHGTPTNEAQDIVQEVFATLLSTLPNFDFDRRQGRFRTWLWRISHNVIVDWARRQTRRKNAEQKWQARLAELQDNEDSRAEWNLAHKQRVLEFALDRVRVATQPKTWMCFDEHLRKGRRASAVAEELDLTANSVYVNASRVLKRLRTLCADYGETLDED